MIDDKPAWSSTNQLDATQGVPPRLDNSRDVGLFIAVQELAD